MSTYTRLYRDGDAYSNQGQGQQQGLKLSI